MIENADLSEIDEILNCNYSEGQQGCQDEHNTIVVDGYDVYVDEDGELLTDVTLLRQLVELRRQIGSEKKVPLYWIAWNRVLVLLATKKPTTKESFLEIKWIGEKWFDSYGELFMQKIKEYLES